MKKGADLTISNLKYIIACCEKADTQIVVFTVPMQDGNFKLLKFTEDFENKTYTTDLILYDNE